MPHPCAEHAAMIAGAKPRLHCGKQKMLQNVFFSFVSCNYSYFIKYYMVFCFLILKCGGETAWKSRIIFHTISCGTN